MWEPNPDPYTMEVRDPEKKSKFKGMKSFMAYSIIPSVSVWVCEGVCVCGCEHV